jgi:hypothetical protein
MSRAFACSKNIDVFVILLCFDLVQLLKKKESLCLHFPPLFLLNLISLLKAESCSSARSQLDAHMNFFPHDPVPIL